MPVETAVETYVRACCERNSTLRSRLLETCLAENVRMVTRSREIRGRAALIDELNRFLASPQLLRIRLASALDAGGTTFRYRAIADFEDGTSAEAFDAGELDDSGHIVLILTFAGPLADADVSPA
jgi:hypothetical protein